VDRSVVLNTPSDADLVGDLQAFQVFFHRPATGGAALDQVVEQVVVGEHRGEQLAVVVAFGAFTGCH
jgi:hypothetical protein